MTAQDWQPIFERALEGYASEQRGGITEINTRNLLKFMQRTKGFPEVGEEERQHVSKLLANFFSKEFGPLWDGSKYRDYRSKGKSLLVGTENLTDLVRRV